MVRQGQSPATLGTQRGGSISERDMGELGPEPLNQPRAMQASVPRAPTHCLQLYPGAMGHGPFGVCQNCWKSFHIDLCSIPAPESDCIGPYPTVWMHRPVPHSLTAKTCGPSVPCPCPAPGGRVDTESQDLFLQHALFIAALLRTCLSQPISGLRRFLTCNLNM